MPLPEWIEITPLTADVEARITVPGSKSITNRALILAALAEGETAMDGALWSEDTQLMVACLRDLGFMVNVAADRQEPGNRTLIVYGQGGRIPQGGPPGQPLELYVGNAGTTARFMAALVCLGSGAYRLRGAPRMQERPQAALFSALRELGYRIDTPNDRLPALIHGAGPRSGQCRVSIADSSQFASALLLGKRAGKWSVEVVGENAEESPYVAMTSKMIEAFPHGGGRFLVEPDASSGSYFWGAARLTRPAAGAGMRGATGPNSPGSTAAARVSPANPVVGWPESGWQIDEAFPRFLDFPASISRRTDLGDSIMTAMVLASVCAVGPVTFTDLGRLRVQECERVAALRTELARCGAAVREEGDALTVWPSAARLHGAEIETYNDHRIAMCFAILGLKVPGIKIQNPACVKKTFPTFFQKLAGPPPGGLGVGLFDPQTGRALAMEDLLAD